ncbi:hypothetical protein AQJ91_35795 [Streptomyces dysideae]|uniref:Uncharacterized protein n=1 Tax=Streptomyces dysideae TaxID=909626 RepID=A0A101UTG6_9ACTN|nr:hypothetical protein AQJ91_35795 [Streptomyces dysideae]
MVHGAEFGIIVHPGIHAVHAAAESGSFCGGDVPHRQYMNRLHGSTVAHHYPSPDCPTDCLHQGRLALRYPDHGNLNVAQHTRAESMRARPAPLPLQHPDHVGVTHPPPRPPAGQGTPERPSRNSA